MVVDMRLWSGRDHKLIVNAKNVHLADDLMLSRKGAPVHEISRNRVYWN